jgi:hypothetical protein
VLAAKREISLSRARTHFILVPTAHTHTRMKLQSLARVRVRRTLSPGAEKCATLFSLEAVFNNAFGAPFISLGVCMQAELRHAPH